MNKLSLLIINDHRVEDVKTLIDTILNTFKEDTFIENVSNIKTEITSENITIDFDFDSKLIESDICSFIDDILIHFEVLVYYSLE